MGGGGNAHGAVECCVHTRARERATLCGGFRVDGARGAINGNTHTLGGQQQHTQTGAHTL